MWICKLQIKHDCFIGNKCEKYKVSTISVPFSVYVEKGVTYSPELHTVWGEEKNIKQFVDALRKDTNIKHMEVHGNKIFLVEVTKKKIPVTVRAAMGPQIIFTKPIYINAKGEEVWEVATWKKELLIDFIRDVKKIAKKVVVERMENSFLDDIYYSALLPKLTEKQKHALTLAYEHGYYEWPKKASLGKLAKLMKVSLPTFREHLKRAEQKFLPELIKKYNPHI
ncbi:helix-turn-helix domain-containing protein [Candidatus Woesearchaeota archaeon]|nr:helix-turn-helix domain-containing protein [Candidatus Woesearchaeota archaeon]